MQRNTFWIVKQSRITAISQNIVTYRKSITRFKVQGDFFQTYTCLVSMDHIETLSLDLRKAIDILTSAQGHPSLYPHQEKMLEFLVCGQNSINQLPCGAGKSYPAISFPHILDILRDTFNYKFPRETRVLLIVPLVNIFYSLEVDLVKLKIPYQVMLAGTGSKVDPYEKVVVISPEKLMDKLTLKSITSLKWSAISLDEPHLALGRLK